MLPIPFDIIHTLYDFTPLEDLVNFCSTCKALHGHLANDSLWKRVCAPYGLKDFTYLGSVSPYTIYSELILPYSPILGLWANDHPFRGNVIEFRLFAGDENEHGGIIGEVWSFATHVDRDPLPPSYIRATKISFESDPTEEPLHGTGTAEADTRPKVRVFCYSDPSAPPSRHPATLYVRSETNTAYHLELPDETVYFPCVRCGDFPGYDEGPRLPLLPVQAECQLDHSSLTKTYPTARLPLIWAAPANMLIDRPPAMSIQCSQDTDSSPCPCAALHTPPISYKSLDQRPPRYYPMKSTILPGVDPRSLEWTVENLEGLWYGPCGPHGTQLVYVSVQAPDRFCQLVALKLAGDPACLSLSLSWVLDVVEEDSANMQIIRDVWTASLQSAGLTMTNPAVLTPARLLHGVAAEGFGRTKNSDDAVGGLIDADELRLYWGKMFHIFRRYKGRDVGL